MLKFIHATGQFKAHFRKSVEDKIPTKSHHNAELCITYEALEKAISGVTSWKHVA